MNTTGIRDHNLFSATAVKFKSSVLKTLQHLLCTLKLISFYPKILFIVVSLSQFYCVCIWLWRLSHWLFI